MKNLIYSIPLLAIIAFCGCNKIGGTTNTYNLKGRMLQDCTGKPLALYSMNLFWKAPSSLYTSQELGTATTDLQGNFTISNISSKYLEGLQLYHHLDADNIVKWYSNFSVPIMPGDNGRTVDLGDFYIAQEKKSLLKLTINTSSFKPTDTLYIGIHSNYYRRVFPITASAFVEFSTVISVPALSENPPQNFALYWGAGKAYFDSLNSPLPPANASQHLFYAKTAICANPDTTYQTIP